MSRLQRVSVCVLGVGWRQRAKIAGEGSEWKLPLNKVMNSSTLNSEHRQGYEPPPGGEGVLRRSRPIQERPPYRLTGFCLKIRA